MSLSIGIEDQLKVHHTADSFPFRHSHYASRCQRIYKLVSENVSHANSVKLTRLEALWHKLGFTKLFPSPLRADLFPAPIEVDTPN
jgi:hypothetical protein